MDYMVILTIFILPIHGHGIYLHLYASLSVSFITDFRVFRVLVFYSLGQIFFLRYFIIFGYNCKWDVFLISLLVCYQCINNLKVFSILILYPATLLNHLFQQFLLAFLQFLYIKIDIVHWYSVMQTVTILFLPLTFIFLFFPFFV